MKIESIKEKLHNAIIQAERSTSKKTSLPILNNIILEVKNKKLFIKSTNLEIGLELEVSAKVEGDYITALNPMVLNNLLSNLFNEDKIEIEDIDNNLHIKTKNGSISIKTTKPDDFPIIPKINPTNLLKINKQEFINSLKSVIYASALSDIKPEISSVYIYTKDDNLVFVATDSFRLSEKKIKNNNLPLKEDLNIILPLKNGLEISRILSDYNNEDEDIELIVDNNQIAIISNGLYITSRIIDGVYPDYNQIMPKNFKTSVEVDRQDFINTLKLAGVFSDKFNRLKLIVEKDNLIIETKNTETGEGLFKIKINNQSGDNIDLVVNSRYLLEVFQSFDDNKVFLGLNKEGDRSKPLYIKGESDNTFQALVMPISI